MVIKLYEDDNIEVFNNNFIYKKNEKSETEAILDLSYRYYMLEQMSKKMVEEYNINVKDIADKIMDTIHEN